MIKLTQNIQGEDLSAVYIALCAPWAVLWLLNDEQPLLLNFKESTETVEGWWSIAMLLSKNTAREFQALSFCTSSKSSLLKKIDNSVYNYSYSNYLYLHLYFHMFSTRKLDS